METMEKPFDKFVLGTQYYRAPTPLPEEWEGDLERIAALGLDCIQLRVLWRRNERVRGRYEFDDLDRLMTLARANGVKVIIKFMLENAPDYVFRDLGGTPVAPDGIPMDYTGNGAFYLGGHRPCFDNPEVMAAAVEFVRRVVERYRDDPALLLWNVWNEPRIHRGECACVHSKAAFHGWLKERFGTVEQLNGFLGKAWDSFESVQVPRTCRSYVDMFLWRQWSHSTLVGWLRTLRDAVKALDDRHPVIAHVGACNVINEPVDDLTDDWAIARLFDFYGTSFSIGERFETPVECAWPFLIAARLYDCSPYFWVYELYPEWGDWQGRVTPADFRYKIMSAVACGAKGLVLWQYRAERLGHENDLAGLVNIDGTPKAVTREFQTLQEELKPWRRFLAEAEPATDPVGILFDLDSNLIGSVESRDKWGKPRRAHGGIQPAVDAIQGIFTLCHELKLVPRIIDSRHLAEAVASLKVLYLPECFIICEETAEILKRFAARGGLLVAEEGLALRHPNTWLNYPWPGNGMSDLFGVRLEERVESLKVRRPWRLQLDGAAVESIGYAAALEPHSPETLVLYRWEDGRAAAVRKGSCVFLGFSPGCWTLAAGRRGEPADAERFIAAKAIVRELLEEKISLPDWPDGIMVRTLRTGKEVCHVVFNYSDEERTFPLDGRRITLQGHESRIF